MTVKIEEYSFFQRMMPPDTDRVWAMEIEDKPAWSNGHFLVIGAPPRGLDIMEPSLKSYKSYLRLDYDWMIFPVGVTDYHSGEVVFNDRRTLLHLPYFMAARSQFSGCTFWACSAVPSVPVMVKDANGDRVALIMPVYRDFTFHELALCPKTAPEFGALIEAPK